VSGLSLLISPKEPRLGGRVARSAALLAISGAANRAAGGDRRASVAEGAATDRAASVRLIVHDPIRIPAIAAPTPRDAKALADRVHAIVAEAVDKLQNSPQCT
jgi:hypothetical protein